MTWATIFNFLEVVKDNYNNNPIFTVKRDLAVKNARLNFKAIIAKANVEHYLYLSMTLSLYDQDIVLWAEDTVTKLRARDFVNLDIEHLIEEVDALGKSQRHGVKSLLRRLLEHLLKRCYVPLPECHAGWQREIRNFRNDLQDLFDDAPSLRNFALEVLPQCYDKALQSVQEDYPQIAFSRTWLEEYELETLLNGHIWES